MKTCIHTFGIMAIASALAFAQEPPPAGGSDGQGPRGPRGPRPNPEEIFKKLDTDSSGAVSLDEFKAGPRAQKNPERAAAIFKKIDADGNGEVTLEEFKAHRPERMQRKGGGPRGPKPEGDSAPPEAPPAE